MAGAKISSLLDGGGQHVAAAADGFDELGVPAVILQFAAQAGDGDVDRAIERTGLAAAQEVKKHIPRQHAAGAVQQSDQKHVFATGYGNFNAGWVKQAAARGF